MTGASLCPCAACYNAPPASLAPQQQQSSIRAKGSKRDQKKGSTSYRYGGSAAAVGGGGGPFGLGRLRRTPSFGSMASGSDRVGLCEAAGAFAGAGAGDGGK